jgi:hypothetical protein
VHPSKFFEEVHCKTDIDTVEIFDNGIKEKLKNIHPKNFLKSKITMPVFKIRIEYDTDKGNHKAAERYMVMDSKDEMEYADFWVDMFCRDYNQENPQHQMKNCQVVGVERICDAVLPIG